mgnify:FL=1
MRPMDVSRQAKGLDHFRRIFDLPCCYFCLYMMPINNNWICAKHNLNFGPINEVDSVSNLVEFCCADKEPV